MKSSTRDKAEGAFKKVKGKMKEETGKATRSRDLRDRADGRKNRRESAAQNRRC
jgi:uncharacterized protein YjbJ (UPF0337 family)